MRYQQPYGIADLDAPYINGDASIGRNGSIPPAAAFEQPMRELVALINASGITPTDDELDQLMRSVRSQRVNAATATNTGAGQENALVVEFIPPIAEFTMGMPLRVLVVADNTGPCTISVDGNIDPLVRANGADLDAGDIKAAQVVDLLWDGTNWQIANFRGVNALAENNNTYLTQIPYIADSSLAANAITAIFSPALTTVTPGDPILVKLANNITGPATIIVNALPSKNITRVDGSALHSGDAVAGQIMLMVYDGTGFQLLASFGGSSNAAPLAAQAVNLIGSSAGGTKLAVFSADELIVESALGGSTYRGANLAFAFNGATVGVNGMDIGTVPAAADLAFYAIYKPSTAGWGIIGTAACHGPVYTGGNMPAGYTASCLLSAVVSFAGNVPRFYQDDKDIWIRQTDFVNSVGYTAWQAASCANCVPVAAKEVSGYGAFNAVESLTLASTVDGENGPGFLTLGGVDYQYAFFPGYGSWGPLPMITPQTVWWRIWTAYGSNGSGNIAINSYKI